MEPVSPVISEESSHLEVVAARKQPQYKPIPLIRSKDGSLLISRWRLTEAERDALLAGADIFLLVMDFGMPLQPVKLVVDECSATSSEIRDLVRN